MQTLGIYSIHDLRAMDLVRRDINSLLAAGELRRLSRGWYCGPQANDAVAQAIRHRARVGCLTGCGVHGVWVPEDPRIHVLAGSKRLPVLSPTMLWHPWSGTQPHTALFPLDQCLEQVIHRHDSETALICLESAVNRELTTTGCAEELIAAASAKKRGGLKFFDPKSESGTETRVRLALQNRGIRVRSQVQVDGVGRVDMIAGDALIIECDSQAFHTAEENYERDRRRDLIAMHTGLRTIRLTYGQVFRSWAETRKLLSDILRTRLHRRFPRPVLSAPGRS